MTMNTLCPKSLVQSLRTLSARETQLIILSSTGMTDKEIALQLGISRMTVTTLWSKLRLRIGIPSRMVAIAAMSSSVARMVGTLPPPTPQLQGSIIDSSRIRLVVTTKRIVLACSPQATALLRVTPGFALPKCEAEEIGPGFDGHSWAYGIGECHEILGMPVEIGYGQRSHRLSLDCRVWDDPDFHRVLVVDFTQDLGQAIVHVA